MNKLPAIVLSTLALTTGCTSTETPPVDSDETTIIFSDDGCEKPIVHGDTFYTMIDLAIRKALDGTPNHTNKPCKLSVEIQGNPKLDVAKGLIADELESIHEQRTGSTTLVVSDNVYLPLEILVSDGTSPSKTDAASIEVPNSSFSE